MEGGMRVLAVLVFMSTMVSGCASLQAMDADPGYPKSFPELEKPILDCPILDGSYLNQGIQYNPTSGLTASAVLTRDVLELAESFADDSDVIRFSSDERVISGALGHGKAVGHTFLLKAPSGREWQPPMGSTSCTNGELSYRIGENWSGSQIGIVGSNDTVVFHVAVDGSLIVRRAHQAGGIIFVIPFWSTSNTYFYRFPAVQDKKRMN